MAMPNNVQEMFGPATARITMSAVAIAEKGLMIDINTSTGVGAKASASASRRVIGVNEDVCAASGSLVVKSGIFRMDNSVSSPVTAGMIGTTCYVEDEHTVAAAASNSNAAGKVVDVDTNGVWVKIGILN